MILVHLTIALLFLFGAVFKQLDLLALYGQSVQSVQLLPWSVYAWGIVAGCLLLVLTVILEYMKSYTSMYLLSRLLFEVSLLVVNLLSFYSIFYAWRYLQNGWLDLIPLVFMPYFSLGVALLMIQLFDFNYPFKARVAISMLFSVIAVILVFLHLL